MAAGIRSGCRRMIDNRTGPKELPRLMLRKTRFLIAKTQLEANSAREERFLLASLVRNDSEKQRQDLGTKDAGPGSGATQ